jgi:hypothetical protein
VVIIVLQLPPGHVLHAWYEVQYPPDWGFEQYVPSLHEELDVQEPPPNGGNGKKPFPTEVQV